MSLSIIPVPDQDDETLHEIKVNGVLRGTVWREKSRVFDKYHRPTPRFNERWFAHREGTDEDEIIGKGEARSANRKGDGFFKRYDAIEALLKPPSADD